jgi:hypothetical protein
MPIETGGQRELILRLLLRGLITVTKLSQAQHKLLQGAFTVVCRRLFPRAINVRTR